MDYEAFFKKELADLRDEGNYRVFADLERRSGQFPSAARHKDLLAFEEFHPPVSPARIPARRGYAFRSSRSSATISSQEGG